MSTASNCYLTQCRYTYGNYGSYNRSRGYDKEICTLVNHIQNGGLEISTITPPKSNSEGLKIDGDVTITGTLYTSSGQVAQTSSITPSPSTSSSQRYKNDIKPQYLSKSKEILNITPKTFKYNGVNDKVHVGAIAEELDSMGLKEYVKYDELGRPDGIYYQSLVTPLIQLVKDLTNNLEEIDKRIQKLENLSKN